MPGRPAAHRAERALDLLPHEQLVAGTLYEEDDEDALEEEQRQGEAPVDRGLRYFVIIGAVLVIILVIGLAAR